MPYRARDIYRGRRKFRLPLTIFLVILGVLLLGALGLFYGLQQFLVYDQEGVHLELPYMREDEPEEVVEATPAPTLAPLDVTVVYDPPDFSSLDLAVWEGLEPVRAYYAPLSDVMSDTARSNAVAIASSGFSGLVLELKDRSGRLAWNSSAELARGYGAAGSLELSQLVAQLHDAGLTAIAQISCCADELMATRNWPITLQQNGQAYRDDSGVYWLDPYSKTLSNYLISLMRELALAGFDEIVLADLYHPISDEPFVYSGTQMGESDPVTGVCLLAKRLVSATAGSDTVISLKLDSSSLRNRDAARTGQDLTILWRMFSRLYCLSSPEIAASDLELACETMPAGSAGTRFVPIVGIIPEGMESYLVAVYW